MARPEKNTAPAKDAPREDAPADRPARRRRGGWGPALVLVVVGVVAVLLFQQALRMAPDWLNPFATEDKDRSSPAVLQSIRDLSRFEAASGNYQVIVDLEKDAAWLPASVKGQRTLFVGNGSVDAYVDFSRLGSGAITMNADRTEVTVKLPRAELERANLDPKKSYVFSTQRGLLDRVGDFFSSNPADQQQLNVLAAQKIQDAATASGLRERADQNTRLMLENMLKALGFKKVTIQQAGGQ
ncbi:DUF4230 domain-containing protein [Actinomadura kijaniata]|uniref:DUF4230 domain-containing protein n=1 Tax=Actinomadura namibiensis TaxID=182080 RepID=A0A7W3QLD4_ACTNM|nr:DUF4230 domain-containing protein [Actinomadura namibiensis]MBA8951311.1 hypothetical protein [Actinomadura namibiensis]